MNSDSDQDRGDYLASVSEDYYYAMHPDPLHPMSEAEKARAIEAYKSLTSTQNQQELNTLVKESHR